MKAKISSLQAELKKIQKHIKQLSELESLVATREKLELRRIPDKVWAIRAKIIY